MSVTGKVATTVNTASGDVEHYNIKVKANKHGNSPKSVVETVF